eukprot:1153649-Pelagomonas_calceolata.AAC.1
MGIWRVVCHAPGRPDSPPPALLRHAPSNPTPRSPLKTKCMPCGRTSVQQGGCPCPEEGFRRDQGIKGKSTLCLFPDGSNLSSTPEYMYKPLTRKAHTISRGGEKDTLCRWESLEGSILNARGRTAS